MADLAIYFIISKVTGNYLGVNDFEKRSLDGRWEGLWKYHELNYWQNDDTLFCGSIIDALAKKQ